MSARRTLAILVSVVSALPACGGGGDDDGGSEDKPDTRARYEQSSTEGTSAYRGLREMALGAAEHDLPSQSDEAPDIVGVVIDIPEGGEFATLAALSDGSTSLYTSVGGGIIGAGEHETVARANARLLEAAQAQLDELPASDSTDHPPAGRVRLFVVTRDGRHVDDMPEDDFWEPGRGRFAAIVEAAQDVLTELRRADPG